MNTITFTPDSIRLEEGDIYLTSKIGNLKENIYYRTTNTKPHDPVLATTNTSIPNVKHIDRTLFVKPDVDVEELQYDYTEEYFKEVEFIETDEVNAFKHGFKAGYNANKKQFTLDEFIEAIQIAFRNGQSHKMDYTKCNELIFEKFRPLCIPKQVICDQEYNVIEVKWI